MIPDEPVNREASDARARIVETYSYDPYTNTVPAHRAQLDSGGTKKLNMPPKKGRRLQSAAPKQKSLLNRKVQYQAFNSNRQTPIMAQRYFLRQDMVNKNLIAKNNQAAKQ